MVVVSSFNWKLSVVETVNAFCELVLTVSVFLDSNQLPFLMNKLASAKL